MYEIKKGAKNRKVAAVTKIGFFCVMLHDATQEQLQALYEIGHKDVIFNAKRKPKKVEETTEDGE